MARSLQNTRPPIILLSGPVLGLIVGSMLCCTTFLYLNHDRESKQWVNMTQREGHWPPPSGDFNWCEPDYVYTPWVTEVLNSVTSLIFCVGPMLLWSQTNNSEVKLNLALVAAIGLGSVAFHATLHYKARASRRPLSALTLTDTHTQHRYTHTHPEHQHSLDPVNTRDRHSCSTSSQ